MVSLYTEHMGDMLCAEGFALVSASFLWRCTKILAAIINNYLMMAHDLQQLQYRLYSIQPCFKPILIHALLRYCFLNLALFVESLKLTVQYKPHLINPATVLILTQMAPHN